MTRDDIIRMAREAGYQHPDAVGTCEDFAYFDLERFAALVAAAEREACCSGEVISAANIYGGDFPHQVVEKYQAAIRARGQA